jgi:hypothetical protein
VEQDDRTPQAKANEAIAWWFAIDASLRRVASLPGDEDRRSWPATASTLAPYITHLEGPSLGPTKSEGIEMVAESTIGGRR